MHISTAFAASKSILNVLKVLAKGTSSLKIYLEIIVIEKLLQITTEKRVREKKSTITVCQLSVCAYEHL